MAKLKRLTPEELVLKTVKAPKGDTGLMGTRGPQGEKGEKGNDGIAGNRGTDGTPGLTGEKGERGNRGEKGEEGLQGVSGSPGARGLQGETGPIPKHKWRGTTLSFEEPDGEFGKAVDLRGRDGASGGGAGGGSIIANITKLRDVQAPEPTDEQVLTFDTAISKWIAADSGQLSVFTVATLPTGSLGRLIYVTDGDSGLATVAVFDGSTWRRIVIGNTVTSI